MCSLAFPYQFWGNYGLFTPHAFRHINIPLLPPAPPPLAPLSLAYMHPTVNYVVDNVEKKHQSDLINLQHSMQNRQMSNSSLSPGIVRSPYILQILLKVVNIFF